MNGLRVFSFFFFLQEQLELRAHSEIKPGWWPLWDTTCLFLSHESQRLPPPSSLPPPPPFRLYSFLLRCLSTQRSLTVVKIMMCPRLPAWGHRETLIFRQSRRSPSSAEGSILGPRVCFMAPASDRQPWLLFHCEHCGTLVAFKW